MALDMTMLSSITTSKAMRTGSRPGSSQLVAQVV
jgi:hypothetical protein